SRCTIVLHRVPAHLLARSAPCSLPLSLHDALPIFAAAAVWTGNRILRAAGLPLELMNAVDFAEAAPEARRAAIELAADALHELRSEEHTSELQSHLNLVCRLLLEKKKYTNTLTQSE